MISNQWKFFLYYLLVSRYYWPLASLFFLSLPATDVTQVWWYVTTALVARFIFEIPSGYLGDRIGHRKTLIIGAGCMTLCAVIFAMSNGALGFVSGAIIMALGQSLRSGTDEAYFYEMLEEENKEKQFAKLWGKMRGNTGLITIFFFIGFPILASIDLSLPFRIGGGLSFLGMIVSLTFEKPNVQQHKIDEGYKSIPEVIGDQRNTGMFFIVLFFALIGGVYSGELNFREPYLVAMGVDVALLGIMVGLSRALMWVYAHVVIPQVDKLSLKQFMYIDLAIMSSGYILVSLDLNKYIILVLFSIIIGYWQSRRGIVSKFLLQTLKDKRYKATILSLYSQSKVILGAILVIIMGYTMEISYSTGFLKVGIFLLTVGMALMLIAGKKLSHFHPNLRKN